MINALRSARDVVEPDSILGRRDVALVALYGVAGISVMGVISGVLRPATSVSTTTDATIVAFGTLFIALSLFAAAIIDTPFAVGLRDKSASYLTGMLLVGGTLVGVSIGDQGLANVYLTPMVLIATYLGLVVPRHWSIPVLVIFLLVILTVHVLNPAASLLDVVSLVALTAAGYVVGSMAHRAHGRAARVADVLSRSDVLTAVLNRRGFFQEFEWELLRAEEAQRPLSLLIMDLDSFKSFNESGGQTAGDNLLHRVGEVLDEILPEAASAGRLGADEFAVLLPNTDQLTADAVGVRIGAALADRIGLSIGVATYVPGKNDPDSDALVRVADSELYAVKRGLDLQKPATETTSRRKHTTTRIDEDLDAQMATPALTYRQLRAAGGPPRPAVGGVQFPWLLQAGWWVVGIAGGVIGLVQVLSGGTTRYDHILQFTLVPWVVICMMMGVLSSQKRTPAPAMFHISYYFTTVMLGLGAGAVLLANDGIVGPIVAALYLKVMFDGFVLPNRHALGTLAMVTGWWLVIVILGPASSLWAVPFELSLLLASFAVGAVAHRAFTDATSRTQAATLNDSLTGLRNRSGLEIDVAAALQRSSEPTRQLAVVFFDLDGFKAINDEIGHVGGDALLRQVAEETAGQLQGAYAIGRVGGDEFAAAVPVTGADDAVRIADELYASISAITPITIGHATYPEDGADLAALMEAADRRTHELKRPDPDPAGA